VCCLHTDGQLFSAGLSVGVSVQTGMCIARVRETVRDTKGTRRSRSRWVADHRRLVARPRATHIPACTLAPSPAGGGLRLRRKRLGRVPACMSIVFESTSPIFQRIRRIRRGLVLLKLFLYQPGTKKVSIVVRNTSIRGTKIVSIVRNKSIRGFITFVIFSYPWNSFHTQRSCFHTWCRIFIPIWYN